MIPKYTVAEIVKQMSDKMSSHADFIQQYNLTEETFSQMMKLSAIWSSREYTIAADFLAVSVNQLLELIPEENLSNISFRALENTDEINELVQQVNDIFDVLTYQLKIGGARRD